MLCFALLCFALLCFSTVEARRKKEEEERKMQTKQKQEKEERNRGKKCGRSSACKQNSTICSSTQSPSCLARHVCFLFSFFFFVLVLSVGLVAEVESEAKQSNMRTGRCTAAAGPAGSLLSFPLPQFFFFFFLLWLLGPLCHVSPSRCRSSCPSAPICLSPTLTVPLLCLHSTFHKQSDVSKNQYNAHTHTKCAQSHVQDTVSAKDQHKRSSNKQRC